MVGTHRVSLAISADSNSKSLAQLRCLETLRSNDCFGVLGLFAKDAGLVDVLLVRLPRSSLRRLIARLI
jgi:hypothetical protein